jgi:hypothetical protein
LSSHNTQGLFSSRLFEVQNGDRCAKILGEQVPIALPRGLGLVAHEFINRALVNRVASQVAGEGMAENMVAAEDCPFALACPAASETPPQ